MNNVNTLAVTKMFDLLEKPLTEMIASIMKVPVAELVSVSEIIYGDLLVQDTDNPDYYHVFGIKLVDDGWTHNLPENILGSPDLKKAIEFITQGINIVYNAVVQKNIKSEYYTAFDTISIRGFEFDPKTFKYKPRYIHPDNYRIICARQFKERIAYYKNNADKLEEGSLKILKQDEENLKKLADTITPEILNVDYTAIEKEKNMNIFTYLGLTYKYSNVEDLQPTEPVEVEEVEEAFDLEELEFH
jgi:hypothetical protein